MGIHASEALFPIFYQLIQADSGRNVQALRKGMMGELFIIFLAYMTHSFLRKTTSKYRFFLIEKGYICFQIKKPMM